MSKEIESLVRIFVFQYVIQHEEYERFQEDAISLIAQYVIRTIQALGRRCKKIAYLQGKNKSNLLHLLWVLDFAKADLLSLSEFLKERQSASRKMPRALFLKLQQFLEEGEEEREEEELGPFNNIRKIRALQPIEQQGLSKSFHELFHKPLEFTYKSTVRQDELKEIELDRLQSQTERALRTAGIPRRITEGKEGQQNPFGLACKKATLVDLLKKNDK